MALRIANNVTSLNAQRNLNNTTSKVSKTMERLSSGFRINRAADDPAGLAISQKMRSQIAGLNQAIKNAETGVSMVQTAEASLTEVHDLLTTMRELVIHSANEAVNDQTMLNADQSQIDQIVSTINRIATNTEFGTLALLDGSYEVSIADGGSSSIAGQGLTADGDVHSNINKSAVFQIGASASQTVSVSISNIGASFLGTNGTQNNTGDASDSRRITHNNNLSVTRTGNTLSAATAGTGVSNRAATGNGSVQNIQDIAINLSDTVADSRVSGTTITAQDVRNDALNVISLAIGEVSDLRNSLGSFQSFNLETTIRSTQVAVENLVSAESLIRDTDMAKEMANFTKLQVLQQVNTSMLAQANTFPQAVLQLLG